MNRFLVEGSGCKVQEAVAVAACISRIRVYFIQTIIWFRVVAHGCAPDVLV